MATPPVCIVTGASGYVGGCIARRVAQAGWRVLETSSRARPGDGRIAFRLGDAIDPRALEGASALVHCAYDFEPLGWRELRALNVAGSDALFRAARSAGVERLIFISSLSAFEGCRSLYGRAKLETEALGESLGALALRPGLVHGGEPGGMFGRLVASVRRSAVLPLPGSGGWPQYPVHEQDLGAVVLRCLDAGLTVPRGPVTVAPERPLSFREMLARIAAALGKRVVLVPFPWQLMWAGLKTLELAGAKSRLRSDSLIGMIHQNPDPSFAALRQLGVECRPFSAEGSVGPRED